MVSVWSLCAAVAQAPEPVAEQTVVAPEPTPTPTPTPTPVAAATPNETVVPEQRATYDALWDAARAGAGQSRACTPSSQH